MKEAYLPLSVIPLTEPRLNPIFTLSYKEHAMKYFNDKHYTLRQSLQLYKNVEPLVQLLDPMTGQVLIECGAHTQGIEIRQELSRNTRQIFDGLPGAMARMSRDGKGDPNANIALTKQLLTYKPTPHITPFDFASWMWRVTGISKSCMTQLDRTRIGASFVQQSGRYMDRSQSGFVYNTYNYLEADEATKKLRRRAAIFEALSEEYADDIESANDRKEAEKADSSIPKISKYLLEDARDILPVKQATASHIMFNSTALRRLFTTRLHKAAESEIYRLMGYIHLICDYVAPSHFADINN